MGSSLTRSSRRTGDMMTLRDVMNQLFEDAWVSPWWGGTEGMAMGVPLDVTEDEDNYVVKASLPGINPDDIQITVQDNMLTIKGESQSEQTQGKEGQRYHLRERRYGAFERSIQLPALVNSDACEASFEHGVLTLRLPKAEEAKPKRITVKSEQGRETIEGRARKPEHR